MTLNTKITYHYLITKLKKENKSYENNAALQKIERIFISS